MAPAWLGPHRLATCDQCGHTFAVGFNPAISADTTTCPNCWNGRVPLNGLAIRSGDRFWIDRTAFFISNPKRWDVVVFRCPMDACQLCIKRIVGLPGESIRIRDGDVSVDGTIVRKTLREQRRLRQRIHDESESTIRWYPESAKTGWKMCHEHWQGMPSGPEVDWLVYHHPARWDGDSTIYDTSEYNAGIPRNLHQIRDVMVSMRVQLSGSGSFQIRILDAGEPILLKIQPAVSRMELIKNGIQVAESMVDECSGSWLNRPIQIEFSLFDRNVLAAMDGREILSYPLASWNPKAYDGTGFSTRDVRPPLGHRLAIGIEDLRIQISDLELWRDVYYIWPIDSSMSKARQPWHLGPAEYCVLGDNSPISADSRTWPGGPVLPRKLFLGKPL
ncbi:MAG: signal peptidase I [Pirellulales bacterium]|nr:signal peptidase I [Pirellulales bacterium]